MRRKIFFGAIWCRARSLAICCVVLTMALSAAADTLTGGIYEVRNGVAGFGGQVQTTGNTILVGHAGTVGSGPEQSAGTTTLDGGVWRRLDFAPAPVALSCFSLE